MHNRKPLNQASVMSIKKRLRCRGSIRRCESEFKPTLFCQLVRAFWNSAANVESALKFAVMEIAAVATLWTLLRGVDHNGTPTNF